MSARDYFDPKAFSYFPRQLTFDQFIAWGIPRTPSSLSFTIEAEQTSDAGMYLGVGNVPGSGVSFSGLQGAQGEA